MTRAQRLCRLEAQHQQALEAAVLRLEHNPTVARYLDTVTRDELRLLAQGDAGAVQRFSAACSLEVR